MKAFCKGLLLMGMISLVNANPDFPLDFNGDGLTDFAVIDNGNTIGVDGYVATGDGFTQTSLGNIGSPVIGQRLFYGDFDGDGKTDIGRLWNNGGSANITVSKPVLKYNTTSMQTAIWADRLGTFAYDQIWYAADFSGDGKTDLAKITANGVATGIDVYVAGSNAFTTSQWISSGTNIKTQRFFIGHFSDPKKMDILKIWDDAGTLSAGVYSSSGSSFTYRHFVVKHGAYDNRFLTGDFNGDGLTDLVNFGPDASHKFIADVFLASGTLPVRAKQFARQQGAYTIGQKWLTGDFTGDGKDDMAKIWNANGRVSIAVHASNGSAFSESQWVEMGSPYYEAQKWFIGDFNNDRKIDIARLWNNNGALAVTVFQSTGSSFTEKLYKNFITGQNAHRNSGTFDYTKKTLVSEINVNGRVAGCVPPSSTASQTFASIQAVLNSGADCILCQKEVYNFDDFLTYRTAEQGLYTEDAEYISQYATMRAVNKLITPLLKAGSQDFVKLQKLIIDGNRYRIGALDKDTTDKAFLQFAIGKYQNISRNVMMSVRSWSTMQLMEHVRSDNNLVENNLVLGAGPDGRGNGLATLEDQCTKGHWGDGLSLKARNTTVCNNFYMDPTDVAIATFSAPGSKIYDNVHSAMSRNAGGSFDMVDGIAFYQIGAHDGYTVYDYIGTTLRNNYLDAFGARIDIGLGLGGKVWVAKNSYICKGGLVIDNVMSGDGFGYGIAINGIEDYTVTGNVSNAVHSGVGNGESVPGDPCVPFLYDPAGVFGNTKLQSGFVKNKAPVLHLLRNNRGPFIPNCPTYGGKKPFIAVCYEVPEARAVARGAYIEMLQRSPTNKELADAMAFLMDTTYEGTTPRNLNTGDMLRKNLAKTSEFVTKFGAIGTSNDAMQLYRVQLWQDEMDKRIKQSIDKNGNYPSIKAVYLNLLQTWSGDKSLQIVSPQGNTVVPVNSTVNLEWLSTGTISTVKVDYSVNGGTSWTTLSSSAPNNGAFQMQIPNIPDSDGIIRISDPTSGSTDQIAISFKKVASAISGNKRILNQLSFNIFNRQSNIIVSGKIKTLAIYNMQGKMVKEIPVHTPNITWDGITDNGTMARKGIYTVQVVSDIERVNFKIVFWK